MGIAKGIDGYGIFNQYNSDKDTFIKLLAEMFDSDLEITEFDIEYNLIKNKQILGNNKTKILSLTVDYEEQRLDDRVSILPNYRLRIPINFENEEFLEIDFSPNKTFQIWFLTFEHYWECFIDHLRWEHTDYEYSREERVHFYKQLRDEYQRILKRLGITELLIITHANYHVEEITDVEQYPEMTFQDILEVANKQDHLAFFNLEKVFTTSHLDQLPINFLQSDILKIAFIDDLNDSTIDYNS